jgi:FixJ family two-component response regulator
MPNIYSSETLVTVVDDDESMRDALKGLLQSVGFAAETFPRRKNSCARAAAIKPAV